MTGRCRQAGMPGLTRSGLMFQELHHLLAEFLVIGLFHHHGMGGAGHDLQLGAGRQLVHGSAHAVEVQVRVLVPADDQDLLAPS